MEQIETRMQVYLSGYKEPHERKVSHYERNPDGPGFRAVPVLFDGEEIRWTIVNECLIIKLPRELGRFVTALRYENDGQQPKRIVEYSDDTSYESYVTQMPTREEFEAEKDLLNVFQ